MRNQLLDFMNGNRRCGVKVFRRGSFIKHLQKVAQNDFSSRSLFRLRCAGRRLPARPIFRGSAWEWLQHHKWNLSRRPFPVLVVWRINFRHELPKSRALLALRYARLRIQSIALDLKLHLRVRRQIEIPGGVLGRAAVRCDDDVALARLPKGEWHDPLPARTATRRRQEQRWRQFGTTNTPEVDIKAVFSIGGKIAAQMLLWPIRAGWIHEVCGNGPPGGFPFAIDFVLGKLSGAQITEPAPRVMHRRRV